jgi:DnaK suppressor protein
MTKGCVKDSDFMQKEKTTHMAVNLSGLSEAQLKQLRKALETKLATVTHEIKELETSLTNQESDDKGAPDEVDRSSFEEEMQRTQLVLDGRKNLQYEVIEAIKRMDDGTYGICEETEEPIGLKRLTASPWTRLSLEAQQDLEKRKKNRMGSGSGMGGYGSSGEMGTESEED